MEPAEEIEALERRREGLGRKIAEQVERRAARSELGQNLDRAGDRAGHHFVKAGTIGIDQLGFVGMLGLQEARSLGEATSRILAAVPFMGTYRCQKLFHRRLVAGEELAVEVPRVPVNQHAAQVEHHDAAAGLCHWLISPCFGMTG